MKKKEQSYAKGIGIVLVAIFLIAWFGGFLAQYGYPSPLTWQTGGGDGYTPTDVDKDNYKLGIGRWNVFETVVDSLDIATVQTSATNYTLYWYSRQGVSWLYHETGNDKYVTLTPEDGGYLWVVMKIPSGQTKYVDYQKIMEMNQYVTQYLYTDIDGDGTKDFAFRYDMKGHAIPNSGYPSITFMGFLLKYDSAFTGSYGINDLTNDTGIGTTTNTQFYSYYLSFSAAKTGVAIWKVEVKITSTDETKVRLKNLEIPTLGFMDVSAFDKLYTSTDYRYVYTISKNFDGALYLKYPANANNKFDMTLSLEYTLVHPDDILITVTVYYLAAQTEAGKTETDSFYAQE
jgi:hypothetical protein